MREMSPRAPFIAAASAIALAIVVAIAGPTAPTPPPQDGGAQLRRRPDVTALTTHYGTFRAPKYVFVDVVAPLGAERVIVDVGACLCWSYPAAAVPGELSVIPVALHGQPFETRVFQLRRSPSTNVPFAGPKLLSELPTFEAKRRAVRP